MEKIYNKKLILWLLLLISVFPLKSQISDKKNEVSYPVPGEIVIGASSPIPTGVTATHESYKDLVECGFNLGLEYGSVDYFKKQFSLIGDLNFKYLIQNNDLFDSKRKDFITAFRNDKHFGGWKFKDEPHFNTLNNLETQYQALYKEDPKALIYINLVGVLNETFTGNLKNFDQYLDLVWKKFNPEVWSYDYYPILKKNGVLKIDYETFYSALESFYKISNKSGKPFWAYCESMEYKASSYSRPAATEPYLRFEAFSALAYGAQGIIYWTYGQRKSNDVETYLSALVNMNGKKTSAWYAAKKVNSEIKKYNDVFYRCNVKMVRHTGDKIYKGTQELKGEFGPFKNIRSGKGGVIVSYIENNGSRYIILVSRDVLNKQKVTLQLNANKKVTDITSTKNTLYNGQKVINVTLEKGGYMIFKEI